VVVGVASAHVYFYARAVVVMLLRVCATG
jgi:hypothetical protein